MAVPYFNRSGLAMSFIMAALGILTFTASGLAGGVWTDSPT
jgi:hypothetical protein